MTTYGLAGRILALNSDDLRDWFRLTHNEPHRVINKLRRYKDARQRELNALRDFASVVTEEESTEYEAETNRLHRACEHMSLAIGHITEVFPQPDFPTKQWPGRVSVERTRTMIHDLERRQQNQ